ncbi:uncharacterized protein TNCV_4686451 [Trichonephila clavipes]|nr:uncharacterized protein TNCV_4686451 [Trichonephila clavipes]
MMKRMKTRTRTTKVVVIKVFCVRDSYEVVRTTIRVLSFSAIAAEENQRPCSEKTKCPVSYTAWIAFGIRLSERCPVPIHSDKRRSTLRRVFSGIRNVTDDLAETKSVMNA